MKEKLTPLTATQLSHDGDPYADGVSAALYLRDPDNNGVELYWDHPKEQWPRTSSGELAMFTRPLDLDALLKEASR